MRLRCDPPSNIKRSYFLHNLSTSSFLSAEAEQPEGLQPVGQALLSLAVTDKTIPTRRLSAASCSRANRSGSGRC